MSQKWTNESGLNPPFKLTFYSHVALTKRLYLHGSKSCSQSTSAHSCHSSSVPRKPLLPAPQLPTLQSPPWAHLLHAVLPPAPPSSNVFKTLCLSYFGILLGVVVFWWKCPEPANSITVIHQFLWNWNPNCQRSYSNYLEGWNNTLGREKQHLFPIGKGDTFACLPPSQAEQGIWQEIMRQQPLLAW